MFLAMLLIVLIGIAIHVYGRFLVAPWFQRHFMKQPEVLLTSDVFNFIMEFISNDPEFMFSEDEDVDATFNEMVDLDNYLDSIWIGG